MDTEPRPPLRAVVLFDGNNWFHSFREYLNRNGLAPAEWRLDFQRFREAITGRLCEMMRLSPGGVETSVLYFSAVPAEDTPDFREALVRLLNYLEAEGIQVRRLPTRTLQITCPHCGRPALRVEEEQVDVAIATELLVCAACREIDVAVLITGDGDFVPAVRATQDRFAIPVYVGGIDVRDTSRELVGTAHDFLELESIVRSCLRERTRLDQDRDE